MEFDRVAERLDGIPHTTRGMGKELYDFILEARPERVLELGFAHGVSTCYMAAALDALGRGSIVTMDRQKTREYDPNLESLAQELGLSRYIEPVYVERSFTWELRHWVDRHEAPIFDFVFNDGGHHWDVVALTYFLSDLLLKPGGWMLFDDLTWTIDKGSLADSKLARSRPEDERQTPQVGEVFRLLVGRNPEYPTTKVTRSGRLGWAQKAS